MILIIAGGRDYNFTETDYGKLDFIHGADPVTKVVCGGATGADACGEIWAKRNNIPVEVFLPDWRLFGSKAGPMRNRQMAMASDAVAFFPGGKGTDSMRAEAKKLNLIIFDFTK